MQPVSSISLFFLLAAAYAGQAYAAPKTHMTTFGKSVSVKWYVGLNESSTFDLKVRPLYIDGRLKEYTIGSPHDITDRLFAVRRAFRINDNLPEEAGSTPRWYWQRGGWLLLDRNTGRVSPINLPDFDPLYSDPSWYRDYIAYCGVSDDGKKLYAIVAQLGRRKPVLKKPVGDATADGTPDSECPAPAWQRQPTRVTFRPEQGPGLTFTVRGHVVDVVNDAEEEEGTE